MDETAAVILIDVCEREVYDSIHHEGQRESHYD